MSDLIFSDPLLVSIYDSFDGPRTDLDAYVRIVEELQAVSVLDIGSGTGCLAVRLSHEGYSVTAVEPARASLEYAKARSGGEGIRWLEGDATSLPSMQVDVAVMTGNVAQVFLSDQSWNETLKGIREYPRGVSGPTDLIAGPGS